MAIHFANTSPHPAKANVLNTAELLEMILVALPPKDILLNANAVCRDFHACITNSVEIQRRLWKLPSKQCQHFAIVVDKRAKTITKVPSSDVQHELDTAHNLGRFWHQECAVYHLRTLNPLISPETEMDLPRQAIRLSLAIWRSETKRLNEGSEVTIAGQLFTDINYNRRNTFLCSKNRHNYVDFTWRAMQLCDPLATEVNINPNHEVRIDDGVTWGDVLATCAPASKYIASRSQRRDLDLRIWIRRSVVLTEDETRMIEEAGDGGLYCGD